MSDSNSLLRALPAIDRLLQQPALTALAERCPPVLLKEAAQAAVAELRRRILADPTTIDPETLSEEQVAQVAARHALARLAPNLRQVINATGTLLHTNLGRAPLATLALEAIVAVSCRYSNLELDLSDGRRGQRHAHVEELLCRLTGAEAAAVVNNNAGAVYLALAALAQGREGIVSRGELVEIGGAFRIPEVMAASGVRLVEVGATNKTHPRDYENAINEHTGLLLKVHTSNYRILGFSAEVSGAELVQLGRRHGIIVMEDLGSGMLFDLSEYGLPREPTVAEAVAAGIDIVTFSGDKLLGGPQAGILLGRRDLIEKIRKHPMARALRMDKLTLAALEATLRLYLDRARALREVPVLAMLAADPEELRLRTENFATRARQALNSRATLSVVSTPATVGGGALPLTELAGFALALTTDAVSVDQLAARLRRQSPPVVGRIADNQLLLNLRTVAPEEEDALLQSLTKALADTDE
ncbi:L-seryl-tRNA(Sec) selenium transferase [Geoalkalibacter halelectricus]|uniref:L-seryl-tRNA(Sec) selenium transferase n=1 Tax=Geoalkalibacter halelectricus TaxID=2847045 RepID=A0ABY5ZR56_9BACT|nr:L-seryl-tRNA(Sec) selenium transferase [Geoalkalibacter halelectricus]MDO3380101.1 L-seryl-tRNA(Sec) selenium transferase [Geoalkalibacter halelectricus]UWZ80380.1 L-seryl-tRNA(Sec) selenium transferase [Geoalkalibacter halelectricus]